uniref:(northern house mosquito) hypothetical protein n=1 Tax=Culex pipiens TaxID=7175 RepID=A0A8D8BGQ8_CULPI
MSRLPMIHQILLHNRNKRTQLTAEQTQLFALPLIRHRPNPLLTHITLGTGRQLHHRRALLQRSQISNLPLANSQLVLALDNFLAAGPGRRRRRRRSFLLLLVLLLVLLVDLHRNLDENARQHDIVRTGAQRLIRAGDVNAAATPVHQRNRTEVRRRAKVQRIGALQRGIDWI